MKSNTLKMSGFALALVASTGALAASQGSAGATSTGSYTNTLGANTTPQVRVFGLLDGTLTSSSATSTANPWGMTFPSAIDQFCVAHSAGGDVRLTFSSAGLTNASGNSIFAVNAATGASTAYVHFVHKTGTAPTAATNVLTATLKTVDIASAQTDLVNCAAPNVTKGILVQGGGAWPTSETGVFTDVVTVTAAPI